MCCGLDIQLVVRGDKLGNGWEVIGDQQSSGLEASALSLLLCFNFLFVGLGIVHHWRVNNPEVGGGIGLLSVIVLGFPGVRLGVARR
jgi:hypothetical protein